MLHEVLPREFCRQIRCQHRHAEGRRKRQPERRAVYHKRILRTEQKSRNTHGIERICLPEQQPPQLADADHDAGAFHRDGLARAEHEQPAKSHDRAELQPAPGFEPSQEPPGDKRQEIQMHSRNREDMPDAHMRERLAARIGQPRLVAEQHPDQHCARLLAHPQTDAAGHGAPPAVNRAPEGRFFERRICRHLRIHAKEQPDVPRPRLRCRIKEIAPPHLVRCAGKYQRIAIIIDRLTREYRA